jgi:hypothetical protein
VGYVYHFNLKIQRVARVALSLRIAIISCRRFISVFNKDFNQQYDIRIAAKSSKNNSIHGEEAVYRIKTQESRQPFHIHIPPEPITRAPIPAD